MEVSKDRPQSAFNTQSDALVEFLKKPEARQHLHEHQIQAVFAAREQLRNPAAGSDVALVVLPTGCGKTGVAVLAAYALNASRVLVITPSVTISKQIHEAFCGSLTRQCFLVERKVIDRQNAHEVCPAGSCITKASEIPLHMNHPLMVVNAHKIGGQSSVKIDDIPNKCYDLVIVDEAHHYPAPTWQLLVDYFQYSARLFLTATPEPITPKFFQPCYVLARQDAVARGIIRNVEFLEVTDGSNEFDRMKAIAKNIQEKLDQHDRKDPNVRHQAMVLTQTVKDLNPAEKFKNAYQAVTGEDCEFYVSNSRRNIVEKFDRGENRTLIIVGRLREGYDNKKISVVAIVRNVAPASKVLFAQFVGRAVRKAHPGDPVTAVVISHQVYNQRINFDRFDKLAEEDYLYDLE